MTPWIILGVFFGILLIMSALSWTPFPHWVTKKLLIFTHKDKRTKLNGRTAGYWIHLYPYGDGNAQAAVEHELVHITQNWRYSWLLVVLLRAVSDRMVLRFEAQAFAVSHLNGRSLDYCSETLANEYNIDGLTVEEARKAILRWVE